MTIATIAFLVQRQDRIVSGLRETAELSNKLIAIFEHREPSDNMDELYSRLRKTVDTVAIDVAAFVQASFHSHQTL